MTLLKIAEKGIKNYPEKNSCIRQRSRDCRVKKKQKRQSNIVRESRGQSLIFTARELWDFDYRFVRQFGISGIHLHPCTYHKAVYRNVKFSSVKSASLYSMDIDVFLLL